MRDKPRCRPRNSQKSVPQNIYYAKSLQTCTFENLCLGRGNARQGEVLEEEAEAEGAGEEGAGEEGAGEEGAGEGEGREGAKSASCRISGPVGTFTMQVTVQVFFFSGPVSTFNMQVTVQVFLIYTVTVSVCSLHIL